SRTIKVNIVIIKYISNKIMVIKKIKINIALLDPVNKDTIINNKTSRKSIYFFSMLFSLNIKTKEEKPAKLISNPILLAFQSPPNSADPILLSPREDKSRL